ncbi:MAG: DUF3006 domain-containing protein [Bacteroidales bacterium]
MKAVVDRIEQNIAVVLFEEHGIILDIPLELLPEGTEEGIWLDIDFSIDRNTTSRMYDKNKELLEKLKRKNKNKNK